MALGRQARKPDLGNVQERLRHLRRGRACPSTDEHEEKAILNEPCATNGETSYQTALYASPEHLYHAENR